MSRDFASTAASRQGFAPHIEIVDPLFHIAIDDRVGIVRIAHLAVQQAEDVDRYINALADVLAVARQRFGTARVLADLRIAPIRSQAAAELLRQRNETLYRPGERVALLVESTLLRMQLRRNLVPEHQNIFVSTDAAEDWLLS